jgi:hypothetical protein
MASRSVVVSSGAGGGGGVESGCCAEIAFGAVSEVVGASESAGVIVSSSGISSSSLSLLESRTVLWSSASCALQTTSGPRSLAKGHRQQKLEGDGGLPSCGFQPLDPPSGDLETIPHAARRHQ